jgi:hypothetical protein
MSERFRSHSTPPILPEESVQRHFAGEGFGLVETYRTREEAEITSGSRKDREKIRKDVEFLKSLETEVILGLHGGRMEEKFPKELTHVDKIPLSPKNLEALSSILPSIKLLFLYRNKHNEAHLREVLPILDGKTEGRGYWLEMFYKRISESSNFFIRDLVIRKDVGEKTE